MDSPENNQITSYTEAKNNNDVDELIILYYFKCCSGKIIFLTILLLIVIYFPFIFFILYCGRPYKNVIIVDRKKKVLILCDKGMIPCCKLNSKTFNIYDIKKIVIYDVAMLRSLKIRRIDCYIISTMDEKTILFSKAYNEQMVNDILTFFRKHFETEYIFVKNEDVKNGNYFPYGNYHPNLNLNNNNYNNSSNEDNINTKSPMNEEAALPAFA